MITTPVALTCLLLLAGCLFNARRVPRPAEEQRDLPPAPELDLKETDDAFSAVEHNAKAHCEREKLPGAFLHQRHAYLTGWRTRASLRNGWRSWSEAEPLVRRSWESVNFAVNHPWDKYKSAARFGWDLLDQPAWRRAEAEKKDISLFPDEDEVIASTPGDDHMQHQVD